MRVNSVLLVGTPPPLPTHTRARPTLSVLIFQNADDGLVYYKQVVSELCSECQVFDSWFVHLQDQMAKNGEPSRVFVVVGVLYSLHLPFHSRRCGLSVKWTSSVCADNSPVQVFTYFGKSIA